MLVQGGYLIEQTFCDGVVSTRLARALNSEESLVVCVPGGPGITGRYMDDMAAAIASDCGLNVLVLDLPNHDSSKRFRGPTLPMEYIEAQEILLKFFDEIRGKYSTMMLLGHSLGGVIALDLLANGVCANGVVLISVPYTFSTKDEFRSLLERLNGGSKDWHNEEEFVKWWSRILPGYFYSQPSADAARILTSKTFHMPNKQFLKGLPTAEESLRSVSISEGKCLYVEGEKEWILPPRNLEDMCGALKQRDLKKVKGAGHFIMLEKKDDLLALIAPFVANIFGRARRLSTP